jgi:Ca-activated chloride channel family protein
MIDWQQFHFLRPAWFALLLPLTLLLWYLTRRDAVSRGWEAVCDAALLPHVLVRPSPAAERRSLWPLAVAGVIATVALAGPAWKRLPQPVFSTTHALVIALDLSRSMGATDLAPNRIERARFKIADLLAQRREGQAALLVYAGDAFTVAPLTDDAATVLAQLPALTPEIMPVPGSRADLALALARDLMRQAGFGRGDVLLVTDEVEGGDAAAEAAALRAEGFRVSVLGVGTPEGAPVPLRDGSFLEDARGEIVVPALDEGALRKLAAAGGGAYRRLALDDADVAAFAALLAQRPAGDETRATTLAADVWRDEGPWLVLALLPLAALGFRRGLVLAVALLLAPMPPPAQALEWRDLWLRPDQQGARALADGDAARAAELFRDPRWQGAARYRAGDFAAAAEALSAVPDADAHYNRGNALARLGRYEEALAAYDETLAQVPEHEDAKFNRDLVRRYLAQQQQQQQQQDQEQQQRQQQAGVQEQGDRHDSSGQPGEAEAEETQSGRRPRPQDGEQAHAGPPSDAGPPQQGDAADDGAAVATPEVATGRHGAAPEQEEPDRRRARQAAGVPAAEGAEAGPGTPAAVADDEPRDEDQQALEQWLRRIPDDPGGLLRRKFQYQYQLRRARGAATDLGGKTW